MPYLIIAIADGAGLLIMLTILIFVIIKKHRAKKDYVGDFIKQKQLEQATTNNIVEKILPNKTQTLLPQQTLMKLKRAQQDALNSKQNKNDSNN